MGMFYVLLLRTGPRWREGVPLREQEGFAEHARFVDGLVDAGVIVLGGPLADDVRVVHAIEAESEEALREILAADPWSGSHLVLEEVTPWRILLDGRSRTARTG